MLAHCKYGYPDDDDGCAVICCRYYTYSASDYRANECMKQAFEPLFYQYGVDLHFVGALTCISSLNAANSTSDISNSHSDG